MCPASNSNSSQCHNAPHLADAEAAGRQLEPGAADQAELPHHHEPELRGQQPPVIALEEPLATFDEELRRERFDPERGVMVLVQLCRNSPRFLQDIFPFALAALVEKRLAVIAPKQRGARASK